MAAELLSLGVVKTIQSAAEVIEGDTYGLPGRALLVEWEVVAEGTVTVLIECSLDGLNWYTMATLSAGELGGGNFLTSAKYIRSNITVNAGSDAVVTSVQAKAYGHEHAPLYGVPQTIVQSGTRVVAPANDTNENILATIRIKGGLLRKNGMLRLVVMWSFTGSTNNKLLRIRMTDATGTQLFLTTQAVLANLEYTVDFIIQNQNSQAAQICRGAAQWGAAAIAPVETTIDTSLDWVVVITATKATGSETVNLEHYSAQVVPFE